MKRFILKNYYGILTIKEYFTVLYNKGVSLTINPPNVKSTDETLDKMVMDKCSISRYGDGEFAIMNGKDLLFQPYSKELSTRLKEVVNSQQTNHIIGIPNVFMDLNWCTGKSFAYWSKYLQLNRKKIYKLLDMKKGYYDALVTRLYVDYKDKSKTEERFNKLKKLWSGRDIVIVEGELSRLGVGNDLFNHARSIIRIICPSKDAFSQYDKILNLVKKQEKSKLILIALGPTATVLAYDLSIEGYQAIDIGHVDIEYEWFLQKVKEKQPVKNKYIGEIDGGTKVDSIRDINYENEIVTRILV